MTMERQSSHLRWTRCGGRTTRRVDQAYRLSAGAVLARTISSGGSFREFCSFLTSLGSSQFERTVKFGKPTYIDKPFATSKADGEEMVSLSVGELLFKPCGLLADDGRGVVGVQISKDPDALIR
ncbi:hypothetical protein ACERK3_03605 [Phycisphaerales bacterium AB-hyl4]|uniref:Uncharacterized protein n=1 Tax=Natronomicrosphaera hydrolytica TaxID=3242702 RepID=A0ABV4U1A1_9BACT